MNPTIKFADFSFIAEKLLGSQYRYAKSMPRCPHHYTLREQWKDDKNFNKVVVLLRKYGYQQHYFRFLNTYYNVNEYKYWTMGAPINETILINKGLINQSHEYNIIANSYNEFYQNPKSIKQNKYIFDKLNIQQNQSVMDIGCGTGLILKYNKIKPENYIGIDPSFSMLDLLKQEYSKYKNRVINCYFEDFYIKRKFDFIIALFGSCSYISEHFLKRIKYFLNKSGKYFLMFYKENYKPFYYGDIVKEFNCKSHGIYLEKEFKDCKKEVYDNFNIIHNL